MNEPIDHNGVRQAPESGGVIAQALSRLDRLMRRLRKSEDDVAQPLPDEALTRPFPWEASYPRGLSWDHSLAERPLFDLLDDAVAQFGDRPCLDFLGRKSSYKEIGQLVDRAAKGFQAQGVKKGMRVGLFLPNCPYYVIAFFAVLKAGGTVVNFNPLYAEREIARQIEDLSLIHI